MNATIQLGFDFPEDIRPQFVEQEVGTWSNPCFTLEQYRAMFTAAERAVQSVVGPARRLFELGLQAAKDQHQANAKGKEPGEVCLSCPTTIEPDPSHLEAFVENCMAMIDGEWDSPGIDYKRRFTPTLMTIGLYFHEVGSLVVHQWASGVVAVDYRLGKDAFFRESYRDEVCLIFAPEALFAGYCCAQALGESGEGVASVRAFEFEGRGYVNTAGVYGLGYRECTAWTFCALPDWRGPTYSYRSQCRAWDAGRTERGDLRGLVVKVRGQLVVLDAVAIFYDDKAVDTGVLPVESDDPELDGDETGEPGVGLG